MTGHAMKIGLLLCDDVDDTRRREFGDYPSMFRAWFRLKAPAFTMEAYRCFEGEFPASRGECDGWLISGSRHHVYDSTPWIQELTGFVDGLAGGDRPLVGICFGHQMIAHALGGRVEKAKVGWGLGIEPSMVFEKFDWIDPYLESYNLITLHQDQVVELPEGFHRVAGNNFCPESMISDNRLFLGIQGHPEFSKEYCRNRIEFRRNIIPPDRFEEGLASLHQHLDADSVFDWIVNFYTRAA